MKYFIQIDANEYNETINELIKDPLLFTVLFVCARRARKSEEPHPTLGLLKWEFLISETETEVFGLLPTQHGKLYRCLQNLLRWNFIKKTGKRTGNAQAHIYLYNKDNPVSFGNEQGAEQGANRERIGSGQGESYKDNNVKKEKKEKGAKIFLDHFNLKLKSKNYYYTLNEKITSLYTSFVESDPVGNHDLLIRAVDNIAANSFYRDTAKVDIDNFFGKIDKWLTLEPDPVKGEDNSSYVEKL